MNAAAVLHSPGMGGVRFTGPDGNIFLGMLEDQNPVTYGMPIGEDMREQAIIHVLQGVNPIMPVLKSQDLVTDEEGGVWRVVKRISSTAGITVQYMAIKETPGD